MPNDGPRVQQDGKKHGSSRPRASRRWPPVENGSNGLGSASSLAGGSLPVLVALASALGVLLAVVGIGLSLLSVTVSGRTPAAVASQDPIRSDPHSKGNPNAPIVVDEWFDFQCPACRFYALTRQPDFERLYVDTGKVRYVSHNYPFLGAESYLAAEAAEAAAAQGYYWAYESLLYQRQGAENSGAFSAANLKKFAAELGLNTQAFNAALDQGTYRAAVLEQKRQGEALAVNATPTFFINGKKIVGVPSLDAWQKIIDEELSKKP